MRVYFFGPESSGAKLKGNYLKIIEILSKNGFQVSSKIESDFLQPLSDDALEKIQASGESVLSHMDGIVLETTSTDSEIGYLLAFAILQKKPVLCLYQKGAQIKDILSHLGKNIPPFIMLKSYQPKDLDEIMLHYITLFGIDPEFSDIPNIKFTLRISPKISKYLDWKIKNTDKSKADFLREQIQEISEKDETYQKHIHKGKSGVEPVA